MFYEWWFGALRTEPFHVRVMTFTYRDSETWYRPLMVSLPSNSIVAYNLNIG